MVVTSAKAIEGMVRCDVGRDGRCWRLNGGEDDGRRKVEKMSMAMEDLVLEEKKKKPFWAHGC